MNPIALTAFYTCGIRADDAGAPRSIVADRFAARFMTAEGQALVESMRTLRNPWRSVLARHWLIDHWLRSVLDEEPDTLVVVLGAGFDTRAWRLGAGRWLEVDDVALVSFKESRLPQEECPRPLTRIGVRFDRDDLAAVLAPWRQARRCVVIVEGVLLYLDQVQLEDTAQALATLAPQVDVCFDTMTPTFVQRVGRRTHQRLARHGAPFRIQHTDVAGAWQQAGFTETGRRSIPLAMADLGMAPVPGWLLRSSLLRWLREGYSVAQVRRQSPG